MDKLIWFIIGFLFYSIQPAHAEPISTALLVTTIVSAFVATAAGIGSSIMQAQNQKAVAKYQQQINEQNAKASREAAQAKIINQRRQNKFLQGSQLARLGGMGALAEGSPLDIMGQTAGQEKYDELVTEYEGEVQAVQFQQQAALNAYEAKLATSGLGLNIASQVGGNAFKVSTSLLSGGYGTTGSNSKVEYGTDASGYKIGSNNKGEIHAPLSSGWV